MCGIAGVVDLGGPRQRAPRGEPSCDRAVVQAMCARMQRRGPDDEGFYEDGRAVLGHRRLSILDLAGGHQPMLLAPDGDGGGGGDGDGSGGPPIAVVFNGELYNFAELRQRLIERGHRFTTRSDTEVLLHAYRAFGPDCVEHIDGMFAFALWDPGRGTLLLARDRMGKKPLYFARRGDRIAFASTLSALLADPATPRAIDEHALAEYLALEYVVAPRCLIQGVRKLEPATRAVLGPGGAEDTRRYFHLPPAGSLVLPVAEAERELEARLQQAVRRRLVADVPLGVFLSGGVDSSTVAALAARERRGIETFSIAFDDPSFDESAHARRVARHLGTRHHEERLSVRAAESIVGELGQIWDEPVADASIVPTYLLSRFARRHVTVALGGDGGDELFAGYPTYVAHRLVDTSRLPRHPALVAALRALARALPTSHGNFSLDFKLRKLLAGIDADPAERNYVWLGALSRPLVAELLGTADAPDVYAAARSRYAEATGSHLERVLQQDLALYMCHSVLAKVDRASMAASLEVRAPLLDTAVVELAVSLPLGLKLRGLTGKYLLKRVAEKLLPREIVHRPKKGFGMPVGAWLHGPLQPLLRDALLGPRSLAATGRFRRALVERLVEEHAHKRADHRQPLWTLLMLELWRQAHGL